MTKREREIRAILGRVTDAQERMLNAEVDAYEHGPEYNANHLRWTRDSYETAIAQGVKEVLELGK